MTADFWRYDAACVGSPAPELWDEQVVGESRAQADARHTLALRICAGCPVREQCAAEAATLRVEGIWGGEHLEPLAESCRRQAADITHGTESGYRAHRKRKEPACRNCLSASNRDKRDRAARREKAS